MRIPQRKEGQGRLVSRETRDPQEYTVAYRLNIITNMIEHDGAEPTVGGGSSAAEPYAASMDARFRKDTTTCTPTRKSSTSKTMVWPGSC